MSDQSMNIMSSFPSTASQRTFLRRWRRAQRGQSLVILAIGFLALLAFVGIVTDVSLLFVRYSTLRRAVDAAAVAAAGQMRRVPDEEADPTNSIVGDQGQGFNIANLNLAARQFMELYGLSPREVVVETCYTQTLQLTDTDGLGNNNEFPVDRNGVRLYHYVGGIRQGPNNPTVDPSDLTPGVSNEEDLRRYEQLCKDEELKLVRVTAQIESPTIFLRLFGLPTMMLQESAISQTAVIDVVLIMDVSESMLENTTYDDWYDGLGYDAGGNPLPGYDTVPIPPQLPYGINPGDEWYNAVFQDEAALTTGGTPPYPIALVDMDTSDGPTSPRQQCQARFYPSSHDHHLRRIDVPEDPLTNLRPIYNGITTVPSYAATWLSRLQTDTTFRGFIPTFDYYGCCNDPNGDGNFADLICQPFKQARDAAVQFLQRLDFIRGDRVAYVTFDRSAFLIDPDGPVRAGGTLGLQTPMIETELPITLGDSRDRRGAVDTLEQTVIVRGETNFYADTDTNGRWDGFYTLDGHDPGLGTVEQTVTVAGVSVNRTVIPFTAANNYYQNVNYNNMRQHPVRDDCPFDVAALDSDVMPMDPFDYRDNGDERVGQNDTPLLEILTPGSPYLDTGNPFRFRRGYEYRGSCAGTNMGGALAQSSAAFYDFGRREGSVWIMVMLGDGAAGASNPVSRRELIGAPTAACPTIVDTNPDCFEVRVARQARPYVTATASLGPGAGHLTFDPQAGEYGGFGLCPWVTTSELVNDGRFPFCSDELPETRYFCNPQPGNPDIFYINQTGTPPIPSCYESYDVDDYARDWADWIGLANLPVTGQRFGNERLPTIFTIGFGLTYDLGGCSENDYACERTNNIPDYLGEELLRYIADVGDNSRIDNNWWQRILGTRIPNAGYSVPHACEADEDPNTYSPFAAEVSCGNYYNAPDGDRLNEVFNTISSRMFTRIAQ